MRTARNLAISAILALSAGGSIAAAVTVPAAASVAAPASHVHAVAFSAVPRTWYHT